MSLDNGQSLPTDKCNRHSVPVSHTMRECHSHGNRQDSEHDARVLRVIVEDLESDHADVYGRSALYPLKNLTDDCSVKTLVVCTENVSSADHKSVLYPKHVFVDLVLKNLFLKLVLI